MVKVFRPKRKIVVFLVTPKIILRVGLSTDMIKPFMQYYRCSHAPMKYSVLGSDPVVRGSTNHRSDEITPMPCKPIPRWFLQRELQRAS